MTETRPRRSPPETETLASPAETLKFRDETETRRLQLSRRDRDVKVQILFAVTGLSVDIIFHVHCFQHVNMMSNSNYSIGLQRMNESAVI